MQTVWESLWDRIGNTPLVAVGHLASEFDLKAKILVKAEYLNPFGSVKDRLARALIADAEIRGLLHPGATIIEPTSGNTGIALAALAAIRGYKAIIVMPGNMSAERRSLIAAYGARVELTPAASGMAGAVNRARELERSIPGSFLPDQFTNTAGPDVHAATTGPEIWRDCSGRVDFLVAGVGTGGTISGTGAYLKAQNPRLKVVAVEPAASPILSAGWCGRHAIEGIGAGFVPVNFNQTLCDEIIAVPDAAAFHYARLLARREGMAVGVSSGAALFGAVTIARRAENWGKVVVAVLPDSADRYYSTPLFASETGPGNGTIPKI